MKTTVEAVLLTYCAFPSTVVETGNRWPILHRQIDPNLVHFVLLRS